MNSPATVLELQQRISAMQPLRLQERTLPTAPELSPLLPGGSLREGGIYSVTGSWQLALSFLAPVSQSGAWCGIIGCPELSAEAAAEAGIALDRCVLVPNPGSRATAVADMLSGTVTALIARFPTGVAPHEAERIAARLREQGSTLIVLGDWRRTDAEIQVTNSRWFGLDTGRGALRDRELTVRSNDHRGPRTHTLRFVAGKLAPQRSAVRLVATR
ncbi:hypothetical protein [Leucobacter sp. 1207-22]|uniref:hypothetical protein n=1 Tax=Leucobacter sp. 1207-22 TaxID=2604456 RepID=UPI0040628132